MDNIDYWTECISIAAEECGAVLTAEQITEIAESVQYAHEYYGLAFYSPPSGDRIAAIEREWKAKLEQVSREAEDNQRKAELAIRRALGQWDDTIITIEDGGDVYRHNGYTQQLQ